MPARLPPALPPRPPPPPPPGRAIWGGGRARAGRRRQWQRGTAGGWRGAATSDGMNAIGAGRPPRRACRGEGVDAQVATTTTGKQDVWVEAERPRAKTRGSGAGGRRHSHQGGRPAALAAPAQRLVVECRHTFSAFMTAVLPVYCEHRGQERYGQRLPCRAWRSSRQTSPSYDGLRFWFRSVSRAHSAVMVPDLS